MNVVHNPARTLAKRILYAMPNPMFGIGLLTFRHFRSLFYDRRYVAIHRKLGGSWIGLGGPFEGMRHVRGGIGGCVLNRLLGVYESEVHQQIEESCVAGHDVIVNIGAAEGYYAVGLAMRNPHAKVIAFEGGRAERVYLRRMIELNRVADRVDARGWCTIEGLNDALAESKRPFLLVDCEGCEDHLLNPTEVPNLKYSAILVEVHEDFVPGVSERLLGRFSETHRVEVLRSTQRRKDSIAEVSMLDDQEFELVIDELREAEMQWFMMRPLQSRIAPIGDDRLGSEREATGCVDGQQADRC